MEEQKYGDITLKVYEEDDGMWAGEAYDADGLQIAGCCVPSKESAIYCLKVMLSL